MSFCFSNRTSSHRICSRKFPATSKICGDVCSGHASSCAARPCQQCPFVVPECSAECSGKLQSATSRVSKVSQTKQELAVCNLHSIVTSAGRHLFSAMQTPEVYAYMLILLLTLCNGAGTSALGVRIIPINLLL